VVYPRAACVFLTCGCVCRSRLCDPEVYPQHFSPRLVLICNSRSSLGDPVVSTQPSLGGFGVSLAWVLSEQWSVLLGTILSAQVPRNRILPLALVFSATSV
jgi:hypothetical protein